MIDWLKDFQRTISIIVLVLTILVYPTIVSYMNCFVDQSTLQTLSGKIVAATDNYRPDVKVEMADGRIEFLDFPASYAGVRGWGVSTLPIRVYREKLLSKLVGSNANLKVGYTRYALFEPRMKIWSIRSENVQISFDEFQAAVKSSFFSIPLIVLRIFSCLFVTAMTGLFLYADLRDRNKTKTT